MAIPQNISQVSLAPIFNFIVDIVQKLLLWIRLLIERISPQLSDILLIGIALGLALLLKRWRTFSVLGMTATVILTAMIYLLLKLA